MSVSQGPSVEAPDPRTTSRPRVLVLAPFPPRLDGLHGGSRAMARLLIGLAERCEVGLLYHRNADEPAVDEAVRSACALVEEVARPDSGRDRLRRVRFLLGALHSRPAWATEVYDPRLQDRIEELARAWQPTVVQLEYHVMGQYVRALDSCSAPIVLTQYEPGAAAARDRLRLRRGIERLIGLVDWLAWVSFERRVLARVQACVVLTARDREVLAPLAGNTPLVEIPLAQDVPEEALDPLGTSPPEILFVGSFIHAPNVDAALRLAERIFPLVRVRCPQATLYLVGDQPPPELRRLASERVVVTGRVPTVEPYLDRAAVTVAPLRAGGGMRVKVMEALGAGKATVASPLAVAGLDLVDGREIVLADSDEDFAAAIVNLLEHPERREQLARAARAWATAPRGGQDRASRYLSLYASLLERFPAGVRR